MRRGVGGFRDKQQPLLISKFSKLSSLFSFSGSEGYEGIIVDSESAPLRPNNREWKAERAKSKEYRVQSKVESGKWKIPTDLADPKKPQPFARGGARGKRGTRG